ncbi:hypothetical protein Nepgr_005026 [Nepenthes gracilis]|uniref:Alpha 1,4-glycosyltransferase domain-containing protein n=1 Tax=Nepenthes gracilis TaxID=150966 RepID=A0AAD3S2F2_NEPGR|nr:hypothetical protein Nepgr_005026 [Nepenthes gracilis]
MKQDAREQLFDHRIREFFQRQRLPSSVLHDKDFSGKPVREEGNFSNRKSIQHAPKRVPWCFGSDLPYLFRGTPAYNWFNEMKRGHPLLLKFIEDFATTFDGNKWGHNGPYLSLQGCSESFRSREE